MTIDSDLAWLIIGLMVIGLGFAIYGWLPTHNEYTERVYLFSSIGGAIAIPALLMFIGRFLRRERLVTILGVSFLIGLALQGDLVSTLRVRTISEQEQELLTQIVQNIPDSSKVKLILIVDPSHQLVTSMMFGIFESPNYIEPPLQLLYHNSQLSAWVCDPSQVIIVSQHVCTLTDSGVTMTSDVGSYQFMAKDTVAFEYEGEDQLKLLKAWPVTNATSYNPQALTGISASPLAPHVGFFSRWPFQMQTPFNEHPTSSIVFDKSDTVWSMDHPAFPLVNYGWFGSYTSSEFSSIIAWLTADHDYQIQLTIDPATPDATFKNIALRVNGQVVQLTLQPGSDHTLIAAVPQTVIAQNPEQTQITFYSSPLKILSPLHTPIDQHQLGFAVDRLTVTPTDNASH